MTDVVNYDNGRKNNCRAALWNRIAKHAPDKHRALFLILVDENAWDRVEALHRNYKQHCLIAVERNKKIATALKKSGQLCINANLMDVMRSWPLGVAVDFIVADLQCGMCEDVLHIMEAWAYHPAFSRAGLFLNLQRGREVGLVADLVKGYTDLFNTEHLRKGVPVGGAGANSKNRFLIAYHALAGQFIAVFHRRGMSAADAEKEFRRCIMPTIRPELFRSYSSSRVIMDSGILWHSEAMTWTGRPDGVADAFKGLRTMPVARSISAVLAHRTRQLRKFAA